MIQLPQKQSLLAQTVAVLRDQIQSGAWPRWLPGEWDLCEQLKVSRRTVRGALAQLEHEDVVTKGGRGRRREVSSGGRAVLPPASSKTVILLTPRPLSVRPWFSAVYMDELRGQLSAAGYHMEVHFCGDHPGSRPGPALEQLVSRLRAACWLLPSYTAPVQQWFSQRRLPCVIVGSRHQGVELPSVDVDFRALGRHAAGLLLAKGHQRVVFLTPQSGLAGDLECERGFSEAARQFEHGRGEATVDYHDDTAAGVRKRLEALLQRRPPRIGFLVTGSNYALMTVGFLLRQGLRVPQEAALISSDEDVFMQYAIPSIAHYSASPTLLARKVSRVTLQLVRGGASELRDYRVMPHFVPGETLG